MTRGPLVVLGAINVDLVVTGVALPKPGQTKIGGSFGQHHGGKGGNQAVAAARAGAPVVMLGAVGDDDLGAAALDALAREGVDLTRVRRVPQTATGVALIVVNRRGENQIAVAPGANETLGDVSDELDAIGPSVVLASCEVSYATVSSAARWCRAHEETAFLLNPAPAQPRLRNLVGGAGVITPNAGEIRELSPGSADVRGTARALARRFEGLSIAVTLGEDGALLIQGDREMLVDAPIVEPVDTTGAGDCFNGVLAAAWWAGLPLEDAVRRAVAAAALSVTIEGAREGMPTADRIDAALLA
jgi:ribokinase